MTTPMPDTDPLKREPPGATSKVPEGPADEGGRPAGTPDTGEDAPTGDKHRPIQPRGDEPPRQ